MVELLQGRAQSVGCAFLDQGEWAVLKARSISKDNDKAVKEVVEEIEARKEFPGGSMLRPLPTHVECPECLSWDVDSVETTVV